ncbi:cytidylyltransferase domain-containing protein [Rubripirellula amarantea]|uniref:cytidylyltransferase domain-containing protein n=1 Tax=Rubripirellula amarantea TaxID=2527999 RepID=UPI0013EF0A21|nr:glycosyltransferase family protein [Rubripirellula amarantea]
MNKIVAIVQARVGSSRLPGKTLMQLGDRSVLARVLLRLSQCKKVDQIVVATTTNGEDDRIMNEAVACGFQCFRGSESDVLSRYYGAAKMAEATHVIRVTSDCPFIDPVLIDRMVDHYLEQARNVDYLSNAFERTFPHGLDTEIFSASALAIAHAHGASAAEREHVTPYIYLNPDQFEVSNFSNSENLSHHRWTLDEADDWAFFEAVVGHLPDPLVTTDQVLALLEREPQISEINARVQQKTLADSKPINQKLAG